MYHEINEQTARRAKEMSSFYDYKEGSATAEYRAMIDEAVAIAEKQKEITDPMYHEKIDALLARYCRRLAENRNNYYSIECRCPSIMIAGGSKFPVRKKEKQNAARDRNMEEYQDIQGLLDKIRSVGMGGISSDDPNAIEKLRDKLNSLMESQEQMKQVNAFYRKHKSIDGCPDLSEDTIKSLKESMSRSWRKDPVPFEAYALQNNNSNIKRIRDRIAELERKAENPQTGWKFDGGEVVANTEENRLQIIFDEKPGEEMRARLKGNGFRWAPSQGAWQRQLTNNAIYAAKQIFKKQP